MANQFSGKKPKTRSSATVPPLKSKHPAKSKKSASSAASGKTVGKKKKKVAKPLPDWNEDDDEEFQGLLSNMLSQRKQQAGRSAASTTSKAVAHQEAVRTRLMDHNTRGGEVDDEENGEDEEVAEDEGTHGDDDDDDGDDDEEEEGSGAEDHNGDGSADDTESRAGLVSGFQRAMQETDPDLDEEEEMEMRTIKGKGKAKVSGSIKFAGLIMLRRKCRQDGETPKPTAKDVETLENCGLAVTRTKEPWLELPPDATYEELDQVFSEILSEPFEDLRQRVKNNKPVWELLIPRNRILYRRKEDTLPEISDVQGSWTLGRAIRDKKIYIAPTLPFSKEALATWGLSAPEAKAPTSSMSAGPSTSRKRKINSLESDSKENNEVDSNDGTENRKKRPRLDDNSDEDGSLPPLCHTRTQHATCEPQAEIDLTLDDVAEASITQSPLRERQLPSIFVHKSPSKEFNPYVDPGCYFK